MPGHSSVEQENESSADKGRLASGLPVGICVCMRKAGLGAQAHCWRQGPASCAWKIDAGSRGSATGRLRRYSTRFPLFMNLICISTPPPPMFTGGDGGGHSGLDPTPHSSPSRGPSDMSFPYETDENGLTSGGVERASPDPFPSTMLQATTCSAPFHVAKEKSSV